MLHFFYGVGVLLCFPIDGAVNTMPTPSPSPHSRSDNLHISLLFPPSLIFVVFCVLCSLCLGQSPVVHLPIYSLVLFTASFWLSVFDAVNWC